MIAILVRKAEAEIIGVRQVITRTLQKNSATNGSGEKI